jgi:hypothetical protein
MLRILLFLSGSCSKTEVFKQLYYEKIAVDSAEKSAVLQPRKGLEGCVRPEGSAKPRKARFFAVKPQKMRPNFLKKIS